MLAKPHKFQAFFLIDSLTMPIYKELETNSVCIHEKSVKQKK